MSLDIHTLAGAYALDAVSDIERAAFARHLASCDSCAQEMAELRETVARLAGADATAAPARLKAAVLAEVARTAQVGPGSVGRDGAVRLERSRGWRGWVAAAAAAVVLAAGAGAVGYTISDQRVRAARHAAAAAAALNARMDAVLIAPDARVTTKHLAGGGDVTVIVSRGLDQGVAVLSDMPARSDGDVYQLWLIPGSGNAVSAGVMAPGQRSGTQLLTGVASADAFGVSAERPGGATVPSPPLVTSFGI
jgi:anti-sigma-K factor RskA